MKKKIISICITLFIFLSSTVGVFATYYYQEGIDAPPWFLDLYYQWQDINTVSDIGGVYNLTYTVSQNSSPSVEGATRMTGGPWMWFKKDELAYFQYFLDPGESFYLDMGTTNFINFDGLEFTFNFLVDNTSIDRIVLRRDTFSPFEVSSRMTFVNYTYTNNTNSRQSFAVRCYSANVNSYWKLNIFSSTDLLSLEEKTLLSSNSLGNISSNYESQLNQIIGTQTDILDNIENMLIYYSSIESSVSDIALNTDRIVESLQGTVSSESSSNNANSKNETLSSTVTEFDNIEKNQVQNMQQSLDNLPTLDFNAFSDFAPTVQFVSSTMQQIYDSNQYLQLLINACLLIGIALLLIGRGNRK